MLEARNRAVAARDAYSRAHALSPEHPETLLALARLAATRPARREWLERFLATPRRREESTVKTRNARQLLELVDQLGDRALWRLERLELPAELSLRLHAERAGEARGLLVDLKLGALDDTPVLLDSGASGLHIAKRTARRAGLEPLAGLTLVGGGGDGVHAVTWGVVSELDFGPLAFGDVLGVRAAGSLHPRGVYRAIVGIDVLSGLLVGIEAQAGRLALDLLEEEEEPEDPRALDPWPRSPAAVPILRIEGQLLVPVRFEADRAKTTLFLLDTGATRTMPAHSLVEGSSRLKRGGGGRGRGYGGTIRFAGEVTVATLHIGEADRTLRRLPVLELGARSRLTGVWQGGFLGLDLLSRQRLSLDLQRGELVLDEGRGVSARRRRGRR